MVSSLTGISTVIVATIFIPLSVKKTAAAFGKCTSIQAQCAIEIGGRCDPRTGHWEYGNVRNAGSGGTNRGGAFDQCVSRKLKERKK
jgi:hypothetical protein